MRLGEGAVKRYERYKDSGVEWIGEVPENWKLKRLKYCAKSICEKTSEQDTNKPYIGLEHVESKTGKLLNYDLQETESETILFQADDVLLVNCVRI